MIKDIQVLMKAIADAVHNNDIVKELQLRDILLVLQHTLRNINYTEEKIYWLNTNKQYIHNYDVPRLPKPLRDFHIQALIRCGAIPKKDLIIGQEYYGRYRNSDKGIWTGVEFECTINNGQIYIERCFHFEDDNGFALFVPIKKL